MRSVHSTESCIADRQHGWCSDSMSTCSTSGSVSSPLFDIRDIANAGRGVVATAFIPANSLILISGPPAFHLIFKTYGKETCATCFLWDRGRTLPVRDNDLAKVFCSAECQAQWLEEQGDIGVDAWKRLTAFLRAKGKGTNADDLIAEGARPGVEEIDAAWKEAEQHSKLLQLRAQSSEPVTKAEKKAIRAVEEKIKQNIDTDTLSYLLCATLFRYRHPAEWQRDILSLALDDQPYKTRRDLDIACNSFLQLSTVLPAMLLSSLTPEMCRTVVQADNHNAFGIRSGSEESEEYMGYGVYPLASYFNHSCSPNVNKLRNGRVWEFRSARNINAGEECCITYLGGDEKDMSRAERQDRLNEVWGFACCCARCIAEAAI